MDQDILICSICRETLSPLTQPCHASYCGHIIHEQCILNRTATLGEHATCPSCRCSLIGGSFKLYFDSDDNAETDLQRLSKALAEEIKKVTNINSIAMKHALENKNLTMKIKHLQSNINQLGVKGQKCNQDAVYLRKAIDLAIQKRNQSTEELQKYKRVYDFINNENPAGSLQREDIQQDPQLKEIRNTFFKRNQQLAEMKQKELIEQYSHMKTENMKLQQQLQELKRLRENDAVVIEALKSKRRCTQEIETIDLTDPENSANLLKKANKSDEDSDDDCVIVDPVSTETTPSSPQPSTSGLNTRNIASPRSNPFS